MRIQKKNGRWFKKIYISDSAKNNKQRYSPSFWSKSDSLNLELPQTQNSLEAWYRMVSSTQPADRYIAYRLLQVNRRINERVILFLFFIIKPMGLAPNWPFFSA